MLHINGLVQERCNSSALAMELHLCYTNPSVSLLYEMGELYSTSSPIGYDKVWVVVISDADTITYPTLCLSELIKTSYIYSKPPLHYL